MGYNHYHTFNATIVFPEQYIMGSNEYEIDIQSLIYLGRMRALEMYRNKLIENGDDDGYVSDVSISLNREFTGVLSFGEIPRLSMALEIEFAGVHPDEIADYLRDDRIAEVVWYFTGGWLIGKGAAAIGSRFFGKFARTQIKPINSIINHINKIPNYGPAQQPGNLISSYMLGMIKDDSYIDSIFRNSTLFYDKKKRNNCHE